MSAQLLMLRHGASEHRLCFATADAAPAEDFLSAGEKAQLSGFSFAAKREGFLLGRLAAKRALGALLQEPELQRIEIRSGVYGQPLVHHRRAGSIEVTVSHSRGLAVALAYPAEHPMGIDLESVAADAAVTIIGELEMSAPERNWLAATGIDQATACGVLWTAREALGKSLRVGLNGPLGVLALKDIRSAGEGRWVGRYFNFPRSQCLSQASGSRVLSVALPEAVGLALWPQLPRATGQIPY